MKNIIAFFVICLLITSCGSNKDICKFAYHSNEKTKSRPSYSTLMKNNKKVYSKYKKGDRQMNTKANNEWKYLNSLNRTRRSRDSYKPAEGFGD